MFMDENAHFFALNIFFFNELLRLHISILHRSLWSEEFLASCKIYDILCNVLNFQNGMHFPDSMNASHRRLNTQPFLLLKPNTNILLDFFHLLFLSICLIHSLTLSISFIVVSLRLSTLIAVFLSLLSSLHLVNESIGDKRSKTMVHTILNDF